MLLFYRNESKNLISNIGEAHKVFCFHIPVRVIGVLQNVGIRGDAKEVKMRFDPWCVGRRVRVWFFLFGFSFVHVSSALAGEIDKIFANDYVDVPGLIAEAMTLKGLKGSDVLVASDWDDVVVRIPQPAPPISSVGDLLEMDAEVAHGEIPDIVAKLQAQGISFLVLTARLSGWLPKSLDVFAELGSGMRSLLGMDSALRQDKAHYQVFDLPPLAAIPRKSFLRRVVTADGIAFSSYKAAALAWLIDNRKLKIEKPRLIVFIDDLEVNHTPFENLFPSRSEDVLLIQVTPKSRSSRLDERVHCSVQGMFDFDSLDHSGF